MKQVKGFPPNYLHIKSILGEHKGNIYTYGDVIYNPTGEKIPEDILIHEEVHSKQQRRYATSEFWWMKYCTDSNFRLDQELEAYATQLNWIKENYNNKGVKEALTEYATNLSNPMYKLNITLREAETRIRRVAKDI